MTGAQLLQAILYVLAIVLAVIAAIPGVGGRVSVGWLAVACLAGGLLVPVLAPVT